jgi:acetyl-CoA C-acetyltransferase
MKVGIVAVAQTAYGEHTEWRPHELTYLVVSRALEKAGLPFRDGYQGIVTCSSDHWEGMTLTDIRHGEVAGAHLGPGEEKVCDDGANAVALGCVKVLSGHADIVLVTASCKEREVLDPSIIENFAFDATYQQLIGLDFTQAAALQAVSYMHKHGLKREDFAEVVVKEFRDANDNPRVGRRRNVSVEEVLTSEMLSYPITAMERRPFADGAVALVLAREEKARELTDRPVWITGFGACCDHHNLGDRDLADSPALVSAARDAYRRSGINDPVKEIDLFEISDHYSYQFLMWSEGIGLCDGGQAAKILRSGNMGRNGKHPVNPSGGLFVGVPRYVAGANCVIEAFHQLRGEAGAMAVPGEPRKALCHGTTGPAGQHHCVIVMERGF